MTAALLEVRDLRLQLPSQGQPVPILRGVCLEVAEAEAVALVGESGSGKSMTARSVIRLLPPGAILGGDILVDGEAVLSMNRADLRRYRATKVAMIFQDPSAHVNPVHTVGDFLTESMRVNRGVPAGTARTEALRLLEEVRVPRPELRFRQYPHELSGGMLQRVMIASALAAGPRLLLADEPTTALDVTIQAEIMAILEELGRERRLARLIITHDLELAAATCDRTLVMYAGSIVESAASAALHASPLHPYTSALLASRPSLDHKPRRLPTIPGRPLSAAEAPAGCAYAPRCPLAVDRCRAEAPELRPLRSGLVACHRAEDMAAQAPDPAPSPATDGRP
jgi:oligopeptide/dipeptide ABC transporter ATP-binding protein